MIDSDVLSRAVSTSVPQVPEACFQIIVCFSHIDDDYPFVAFLQALPDLQIIISGPKNDDFILNMYLPRPYKGSRALFADFPTRCVVWPSDCDFLDVVLADPQRYNILFS
jgi:hypothetical protein